MPAADDVPQTSRVRIGDVDPVAKLGLARRPQFTWADAREWSRQHRGAITSREQQLWGEAGEAVSGLDEHVGFWLRFVSNHVSGRFERLVEEAGVTVSEWVALRQLYTTGRASPAALVSSLGMTRGAISKVLDRLEHRGLARRIDDPDDGRAVQVELTRADGTKTTFMTRCRIDTVNELEYFLNGGILQFVLRKLAA